MLSKLSKFPETRVSSQAMRSTDWRMDSALRVRSPRFPMGVATTYSLPASATCLHSGMIKVGGP